MASRLFVILAVVLFLVALVLLVIQQGDARLREGLVLGGLAAFAIGHVG